MTEYFMVLVNTFGVMAVCTLLYGLVQRRVESTFLRGLGIGVALGGGGTVMMAQPIILAPGFQADARGAFIGMAAAFGGPVSALIAVALTVAARVVIGGDGVVVGVSMIGATAVGALAWRHQLSDTRKRTWMEWLSISLICVAPSALALFVVAGNMWPTSAFLSIVISLLVSIFGKMLENEQRRGRRERELAREASTDTLTSLPNRRALEQYAKELERESANNVLFLMLDVDHFKKINDEYGHDEGDAVLREIGAAVRRIVRDTDFAARIGGEEFAVIVRTNSAQAGHLMAERFRKALRVPFGTNQQTRVSVGGFFCEHGPFDYAQAYQRADLALYASKTKGRDCVTFCQNDAPRRQLAS